MSYEEILKALARHDVRFIVVGGVGAILQGAPYTTFDIDIVHERSEENLNRLVAALAEIESVYRLSEHRKLPPSSTALAGTGRQLLTTKFGELDVLGTNDDAALGYEELLPLSEKMSLPDGTALQVLTLKAQIDLKSRSGRPKDKLALELLKAIRDERERQRR